MICTCGECKNCKRRKRYREDPVFRQKAITSSNAAHRRRLQGQETTIEKLKALLVGAAFLFDRLGQKQAAQEIRTALRETRR